MGDVTVEFLPGDEARPEPPDAADRDRTPHRPWRWLLAAAALARRRDRLGRHPSVGRAAGARRTRTRPRAPYTR